MPELWDIYDENKNKTGKTAIRDVTILQKGEYHIVVTGIILNSKNEILISKRAINKKFGGMWECNGGSILAGETSKEGILRELKEELGVTFKPEEAIFLKEVKREKVPQNFKDLWLFRKDINIAAIGGGRNVNVIDSFNYATDIKNQIGSTAKPLYDYGPAIEYNHWKYKSFAPFR